ncbi:hypothetical protein WJX74_007341 [Apatococcus lobatus]|uniref:C3H1-type domain-containing protein n=1 Tax=Apatococcus lobatus TaxID=904363 RepID=A0AAW1SEZ6_9CHLO
MQGPEGSSLVEQGGGDDSSKLSVTQVEELAPPAHLDSLDPKQQICFDFTKGLCTRGDACKYSHDIALIVKVNSQERGICFDFLRGYPLVQGRQSPYLATGGLLGLPSGHGLTPSPGTESMTKAAYMAGVGLPPQWPAGHGMTAQQLAAAEGLLAAARMPQLAVPSPQPQHRPPANDPQSQYARMVAELSSLKLQQSNQQWPLGMQGYSEMPAVHTESQSHGQAAFPLDVSHLQAPAPHLAGHIGLMQQVSELQRALAQKPQLNPALPEMRITEGDAISKPPVTRFVDMLGAAQELLD